MAVVTISRQYGCGGPEIGRAVAEAIGARYLDQALIVETAARIGAPENVISERDERLEGWTQRFLEDLGMAFSGTRESRGARTRRRAPLTDAELLAVTRAVVREVARAGNAVIVGRGAQMILRDNKLTLHVHVVAPLATRIAYVTSHQALSANEARRLIAEMDAQRGAYLRTNYGTNWDDPLLYHIVLNMGRLSMEDAVQLIIFRAAMMGEVKPVVRTEGDEQHAQRLLSSMQAMRESIRGIVSRSGRG